MEESVNPQLTGKIQKIDLCLGKICNRNRTGCKEGKEELKSISGSEKSVCR